MVTQQNSLVTSLLGKIGTSMIETLSEGGNNGNSNRMLKPIFILLVSLLALILVVSTEPFKVILRKNIGKYSLGMLRLFIACVLYVLWGYIIREGAIDFSSSNNEMYILSYAGIFYYCFAGIVFILGIYAVYKSSVISSKHPKDDIANVYRGDSFIFGSLVKKGWSVETVWTFFEPALCLLIGGLITWANVYIGAPILMTALSFAFNESYNVRHVWSVQREQQERMNLHIKKQQMIEVEHYSLTDENIKPVPINQPV